MQQYDLDHLSANLAKIECTQPIGRVCAVEQGVLKVSGLQAHARHGDHVRITLKSGDELTGEVLKLEEGRLFALPEGAPEGVSLGDRVTLESAATLAPCYAWIGRVIDPTGKPLDGRPLMRGERSCQLKAAPVPAPERALLGARLATGKAIFDTMLPIVKGQRIGLFAGSGVGKSSLLAHFAKHLEADVVVLALIGERGREFGTVTGRKRRCGWFDAVLVRQTCATSGVSGIAFTKLDVLDGFETLKICVAYDLDGTRLDYLPTAADQQARCTPIYEEMPGWSESTEGARSWADLPANAIKYVRRVEELIDCPVAFLSTSPERDDTILVTDPFAD